MTSKPTLVLDIACQENYNTPRIAASIRRLTTEEDAAYVQESETYGLRWGYTEPGAEYADLTVSAYLDRERGAWGAGYHYEHFRVENVRHAKAIVKVLAKLERDWARIDAAEGYLSYEDIAAYFLRFARILGIREFRIRDPKNAAMTGHATRKVDGAGLQSWIETVSRDAKAGRVYEHIRR